MSACVFFVSSRLVLCSLLPPVFSSVLSVPNSVAGAKTDPLRDGAVLLLGLGQLILGPERLVALFGIEKT